MGHAIPHFVVSPVDESFEVRGTEINSGGDLKSCFFPEELLTVLAAAGRCERPFFMGSPVHIIKIDAVQIEVV
jgi:hypothetical protein